MHSTMYSLAHVRTDADSEESIGTERDFLWGALVVGYID